MLERLDITPLTAKPGAATDSALVSWSKKAGGKGPPSPGPPCACEAAECRRDPHAHREQPARQDPVQPFAGVLNHRIEVANSAPLLVGAGPQLSRRSSGVGLITSPGGGGRSATVPSAPHPVAPRRPARSGKAAAHPVRPGGPGCRGRSTPRRPGPRPAWCGGVHGGGEAAGEPPGVRRRGYAGSAGPPRVSCASTGGGR